MNELINKLKLSSLKTQKFTLQDKIFLAKCVKCYDADSIHVVIELNNQLSRFTCRLLGIDTAEIRSKNPEERKFARESRDYLKSEILDKLVIIKCGEFDKYGRLLVNVYKFNEEINIEPLLQVGGSLLMNQVCINDLLIERKYAYKYLGGTKMKFNEWHDNSEVN